MAKKIKLDTSKAKEFIIGKGERVVLAVAAVLMVWYLLTGIVTFFTTSSADKQLVEGANQLKRAIANAAFNPETNLPPIKAESKKPWAEIERERIAKLAPAHRIFDPGAVGNDKLRNPTVLPIMLATEDGKPATQIDVVSVPIFHHKLDSTEQHVDFIKGATSIAGGDGRGGSYGGAMSPRPGAGGGMIPGTGGGSTTGGNVQLAKYVKGSRMVVVSALFPYKKQLENFRVALQKTTVRELFEDEKTIPKFFQLSVVRWEINPDGTPKEGSLKTLYDVPTKGDGDVPVIKDNIKKLLALAPVEETEIERYSKYIQPGLTLGMPSLANGEYPEVKLPGIVAEPVSKDAQKAGNAGTGMYPGRGNYPGRGGKFPGGGTGGDLGTPGTGGNLGRASQGSSQSVQIEPLKLAELAKQNEELAEKLKGEFNPFHFQSVSAPTTTPGGIRGGYGVGPRPGFGGGGKKFGTGSGEGAAAPDLGGNTPSTPGKSFSQQPSSIDDLPEYALARFIDADMEAGKTYQYAVRVVMENPNFGLADKVVSRNLAEMKYLTSDWASTPAVTIPPEFDFYLVDEYDLTPEVKQNPHSQTETATNPDEKEIAIVQFHKWIELMNSETTTNKPSGSWAIAERRFVRRGEAIGKDSNIAMHMPQWDASRQDYKITIRALEGRRSAKGEPPPISVDFTPPKGAPIVVDFKGGRLLHDAPTNTRNDTASVDMLVLAPDGKLIVRRSRVDANPNTRRGKERADRLREWREWVDSLINTTAQQQQGNRGGQPGGAGGFPGGGGGGLPGGGG